MTEKDIPSAAEQLAVNGIIDKVPVPVPGVESRPNEEQGPIEVDANIAAIARDRRDKGRKLLELVSAEEVHATEAANARIEQ